MQITFIIDLFMVLSALLAAIYCIVLSRRLKRFNQLENGMGGAIAILSGQVDDMTRALKHAQSAAAGSAAQLTDLTQRAEHGAQRLEIMLASLHDLTEGPTKPQRRVRRRHSNPTEVTE